MLSAESKALQAYARARWQEGLHFERNVSLWRLTHGNIECRILREKSEENLSKTIDTNVNVCVCEMEDMATGQR